MRVNAREQLAPAERLDQIIVGAGAPALDARFLTGAGRQQEDRHRPERGVGADLAQQTKAVERRHHHVRENQIGGDDAFAAASAAAPSATASTS